MFSFSFSFFCSLLLHALIVLSFMKEEKLVKKKDKIVLQIHLFHPQKFNLLPRPQLHMAQKKSFGKRGKKTQKLQKRNSVTESAIEINSQNYQAYLSSYVTPTYPKNLLRKKLGGEVEIGLTIKDGKITEQKILKSSGFIDFDQSCLQSINQWKFFKEVSVSLVQKFKFVPSPQ